VWWAEGADGYLYKFLRVDDASGTANLSTIELQFLSKAPPFGDGHARITMARRYQTLMVNLEKFQAAVGAVTSKFSRHLRAQVEYDVDLQRYVMRSRGGSPIELVDAERMAITRDRQIAQIDALGDVSKQSLSAFLNQSADHPYQLRPSAGGGTPVGERTMLMIDNRQVWFQRQRTPSGDLYPVQELWLGGRKWLVRRLLGASHDYFELKLPTDPRDPLGANSDLRMVFRFKPDGPGIEIQGVGNHEYVNRVTNGRPSGR
jgi:hypothetical protein